MDKKEYEEKYSAAAYLKKHLDEIVNHRIVRKAVKALNLKDKNVYTK